MSRVSSVVAMLLVLGGFQFIGNIYLEFVQTDVYDHEQTFRKGPLFAETKEFEYEVEQVMVEKFKTAIHKISKRNVDFYELSGSGDDSNTTTIDTTNISTGTSRTELPDTTTDQMEITNATTANETDTSPNIGLPNTTETTIDTSSTELPDPTTLTVLSTTMPAKNCPECIEHSTCLQASLGCECDFGYTGNPEDNCADIDECAVDTCTDNNKSCENTDGSYNCICKESFYEDENGDCIKVSTDCGGCSKHASCREGKAECECDKGWTGSADSCKDINECMTECQDSTQTCVNTEGSYQCDCIIGYRNTENGCEPITCEEISFDCTLEDNLSELCDSIGENKTIQFQATPAGYQRSANERCPIDTKNDNKTLGTMYCNIEAAWETPIWLSSCDTGIQEYANVTVNDTNRQEIVSDLAVLTSEPEKLASEDITATVTVLSEATDSAEELNEEDSSSVVSTIANLLESENLMESGQSEQLLLTLDEVAAKLVFKSTKHNSASKFQDVSQKLGFFVVDQQPNINDCQGMIVLQRPDVSNLGFRSDQFEIVNTPLDLDRLYNGQKADSEIFLPESFIGKSSRVSFVAFGNDNAFQTVNSTSTRNTVKSKVNSFILSATVVSDKITITPDGEEISISFNHLQALNETLYSTCSFWKETEKNWSTDGCNLDEEKSTKDFSVCKCTHLTNFATLFDERRACDPGLDIVTIVGCSISSFGLLLTLIVFAFIPHLRKGRKFRSSFLLANLATALLGLNIMLLLSNLPNVIKHGGSCLAIALLMHFFLISTFSWMNCEGIVMYFVLVEPMFSRIHLRNKFVIPSSVIWGWIMPLIFVGILALVNIDYYKFSDDDLSCTVCWLRSDMVIYLSVIPAAILLTINLVLYMCMVYSIGKIGDKVQRSLDNTKKKDLWKNLLIDVTLAVTLGIPWIFGFFMLGGVNEDLSHVFSYVFAVLNSLQGFFLFALYILRNRGIRDAVSISSSMFSVVHRSPGDLTIVQLQRSRSHGSSTDDYENPYHRAHDVSQIFENEGYEFDADAAFNRDITKFKGIPRAVTK